MRDYKKEPIRLFEICAGYGSQGLALNRLREHFPEFDYVLAGWAEFDPMSNKPIDEQPAVLAHNALHGHAELNFGDITKIAWKDVPDFDLLTCSTPCTDISAAGLQAGLEKGSGTRSSIIWNVHDCIREKRPKYIVSENVANILSKKHWPTFKVWLQELERMGYKNFLPPSFPTPWKGGRTKRGVIDASDMGIPQHRERMFCVSILRTKDEPEPTYHFPQPRPLELFLGDLLEEDVDESYFLSEEMMVRFCEKSWDWGEEEGLQQCCSTDEQEEDDEGELNFGECLVAQ